MSASSVALARQYPPVVLADTAELVAAFEASRALPAMVLATDYLREPKPVTAEGVLEEPDVEALGKQLDTVLGEGGRDAVYVVAGWAAAAGLAEATDGRLGRTESADQLTGDDDGKLSAAVALFAGARKLVYTEALARWLGAGPNAGLFDAVLHDLLSAAQDNPPEGTRVASKDLVDQAWHTLVAEVAMGAQARGGRKEIRTDIANETAWLVELLSDLGAADVDDTEGVRLTPLGVWLLREQLASNGVTVPLVGELTEAPAGQLLAAVLAYPPAARQAEIDGWVEAAGVEKAARAVARHAAGTDDDRERALALDVLDGLGAEAEPAVRELLDEPLCRPRALAWLAAKDLADPTSLAPADDDAALVERLAVGLASGGPTGAVAVLIDGRDPSAQVAAIDRLWRVDSPHTGDVLEALGSAHPDKAVAKAARKARFKRLTATRP